MTDRPKPRKRIAPNLAVLTIEIRADDPTDLGEYVREAVEDATQHGEVVNVTYYEEDAK